MRIGHFILDQILAVHDDQLAEAQVVEVAVGSLQAVNPRVPGGLIAVPGVVAPVAAAAGLVGADAANVRVEQRHGIVQPVHAVLADHAQQAHAAAHLEGARSGAAHLRDHLLRIALRPQSLGALVAAVAFGDRNVRFGDVLVSIIPRDAKMNVGSAAVELVLGAIAVDVQVRVAGIGPLLPALADDRMLQAVRPVDQPMERVPFGALPRVPVGRSLVSVQVGVGLVIVLRSHAHDDAVARVRQNAAGVRVVGRADPAKRTVVAILVAVDLLPVARRILSQGVRDRPLKGQSPHRPAQRARGAHKQPAGLYKVAPRPVVVVPHHDAAPVGLSRL